MPPLKTKQDEEKRTAPEGSWDCHHHVFDIAPAKLAFPLADTRHFTPSPAPLSAFVAWAENLGIDHSGMTHGMSYGRDLTSLKYYLDYFQGTGRAFGIIDLETTTDEEIRELHSKGVRGIRIDYHFHHAQNDVEKQADLMKKYAARVAPFGWKIQVYHPHPEYWHELSETVQDLPVEVVLDHYGALKTPSLATYLARQAGSTAAEFDVLAQPGLSAISKLLKEGKLWIKLSAPYRCSEAYPLFPDMQPLVRTLVEANPDRVLYGSDWPHTQPFHRRPAGLKGTDVETYVDVDDAGWLETLKSWLSEEEWHKLMVKNPARFFNYPDVTANRLYS